MKILIVCSKNSGRIVSFITEQVESLVQAGCKVNYFTIERKGMPGYLSGMPKLLNTISAFQPDLIHAHYGLSGLLANLQRKIPVVTTYHGSDINNRKVFLFSKICMFLSVHNIFVSDKMIPKSRPHPNPLQPLSPFGYFLQKEKEIGYGVFEREEERSFGRKKHSLIPCGVDIDLFKPIDKLTARNQLNLEQDKKYILFAGSFTNQVKNPALAKQSVNLIENVELLELKGYSREQVALLMNAVDCVLMTSFSEGSPQFIKEAMACGCPIVAVPVGDVPEVTKNIEGCFLTNYDPDDVAQKLKMALEFGKRTEGRKRIVELGLDAERVARKIIGVYEKVINRK